MVFCIFYIDIAKHLRFGQQEDSHEFLRYVIDGMTKSCLAGVSDKYLFNNGKYM